MAPLGIVAAGLLLLLVLLASIISGVFTAFGGSPGPTGSRPSTSALADIPPAYLAQYTAAARTCPGLDWSVLAAIGKVETDHGRAALPGVRSGANQAGAQGPMQFLPTTFAEVTSRHRLPEGGARPPSPYNVHDAVHAAAAYLCDHGARGNRNLRAALYTYNHASWYVADVLAQAARYRTTGPSPAPTGRYPAPAALAAVTYARSQLGLPYQWGGNGPSHGDTGFDCSGLTQAAYATAGVRLPRTAQAQYDASPQLPAGTDPLPGDLVFYGTPGRVHHVALSLGGGYVIHAPHPGARIRTATLREAGTDLLGWTRPTARTVR
ncbi:NlpC/P60 family protein [Streptomyces paromomycinus]|uniref:Hydrolase Nlp/P60 n=1 Tax=Streptomyces paromomycinus TaxID=92743 RepID=A0A401VUU1_STREY|nr:C40 family peptidase [Streptomyces paromomycinus]GCD40808.1 hydrolase Nlp/P60 [Streptomyces paromomycinus]